MFFYIQFFCVRSFVPFVGFVSSSVAAFYSPIYNDLFDFKLRLLRRMSVSLVHNQFNV